MNGAVARTPARLANITLSDPLKRLSAFVSYAGPPRNVSAYKFAVGAVQAAEALDELSTVVVAKKTMSPATAGKAVTLSSLSREAVLASVTSNVFGAGTVPLSLMPSRWYTVEASVEGSRSLPVPKKMYWLRPATLPGANEPKIGWSLGPPTFGKILVLPAIAGFEDASSVMSNVQTAPSRSPRYALVMKRWPDGPVATGSVCSAFFNCLQPFASCRQSLDVSLMPSLPTSIDA